MLPVGISQLTVTLLIKQNCFTLLPKAQEVLRFHILHKSRIRINPLSLPFLASNMLKDTHTSKGCIMAPSLSKSVLLPSPNF
jgi:hypothetical protein